MVQLPAMMDEGHVQRYPCTCHDTGVCWIVRHPDVRPPVSYDTEEEALEALRRAREGSSDGPG